MRIHIPEYNHAPSQMEIVYRKFIKKEISEQEYHLANALWVVENKFHYKPLTYTQCPQALREYIGRRIAEQQDRDDTFAKKLGYWLNEIYKQKLDNDSNLDLFVWCHEKLSQHGPGPLMDASEKLSKLIVAYQAIPFPFSDFELGLRAKAMDTQAKKHSY